MGTRRDRAASLCVALSAASVLTGCSIGGPPLLEDDGRRSSGQGRAQAAVAADRFGEARGPREGLADRRGTLTDPERRYVPRPSASAAAEDDPYFAGPYFAGRSAGPRPAPDGALIAEADGASPSADALRVGAPARVGADAAAPPLVLRDVDASPQAPAGTQPSGSRAVTAARPVVPAPASRGADAYLPDPAAALIALNAYRLRYGHAPLAYDRELSAVARRHARDLARRGEVSAVAADGSGVIDRLALSGAEPDAAASLVAGGYPSLAEALASWQADATQRRRLLLPEGRRVGIALVEDRRSPYRYYIEVIVATP